MFYTAEKGKDLELCCFQDYLQATYFYFWEAFPS